MTTNLIERLMDAGVEDEIAPAFSEEALALTFANLHAKDLRYVAIWNKWLGWDGHQWKVLEKREAFTIARGICREAAAQINKPNPAKTIASAKTRAAVVSLAGEDRRLAASSDQWDTDPWLLNTPGGVIDLHTGVMRRQLPEDYLTKITAEAPDKLCPTPLWDAFLKTATARNNELEKYLQRICGYCLTGLTIEQQMFFKYGLGSNGKTVFLNTVANIMGDYHKVAPMESFTASAFERHPTDLAMLRGARLVTSVETEEGRQWAESRIKQLTGGDPVSARFMRQDFFEYIPQFKIIIAGNYKPSLRSVNEAIRRRMNLIPFDVTIPKEERDIKLTDKLKAEWPGILAWMIQGCLDWQVQGLARPQVVAEATEKYLLEEDIIKTWMEECCRVDASEWCAIGHLYNCYNDWMDANGHRPWSSKRFSERLDCEDRFKRERGGADSARGFVGLTIWKPAPPVGSDGRPPLAREPIWQKPF
jgi:putative DNA primase/helicase